MENSSCEFRPRICALHDDEVSAPERKLLEAHVALCPACANELRQLQALARLFAKSRNTLAPRSILARLKWEIAWKDGLKLARTLSIAAAVIFAACTVWIWYNQPSNTPELPASSLSLRSDSDGDDPVVQVMMREYGHD